MGHGPQLQLRRITTRWFRTTANIDELPAATEMAGVDMHLGPPAYRELHWHQANEWSYIFNGSVREEGQATYDDLNAGDVRIFLAGLPHTIQALDEGVEFLLVYNSGSFSEDNTFIASELFLQTPKTVLVKNLKTSISAFNNAPQDQLLSSLARPRLRISPPKTSPAPLAPSQITCLTLPISYNSSHTSRTAAASISSISPRSQSLANSAWPQ